MKIERQEFEAARRTGLPRVWTVFDAYRVRNGMVEPVSTGKIARLYAPAVHTELPNRLGKLRDGADEDILRFVGSYGLLGFFELTARTTPESQRIGDPLQWIRQQARTVHLVMDLWRLIQDDDESGLRRALGELRAFPDLPTLPAAEFAVGPRVKRQGFLLGTVKRGPADAALARDIVRTILNENLTGLTAKLSEANEQLQLSFSFRALIDVIYWQLATAVTGGRMQRCAAHGCPGLFIQHDPRQRFCPPWFGGKGESPCSLRERQRDWQIKRRRLREGQEETKQSKQRQRTRTKKGA